MQSIDNFWKRAHRILLECLLGCFIRRKKVLEMVRGGGALLQKKMLRSVHVHPRLLHNRAEERNT
jgi:hypothetical protein